MSITLHPIGKIRLTNNGQFFMDIADAFRPALAGLQEFSHIQVLFWCHKCDNPEARQYTEVPKPYKQAPETLGVFATRSPVRPNPVGLTAAQIIHIDQETGQIQVAYIDADDQTPILDIKPYSPCMDRIREPKTPAWCSHWPQWYEEAGHFDWAGEFTF